MCPRHLSKDYPSEFMPEQVFARIMEEYAEIGGRIITFNNFSDIFAHPSGVAYIEHTLSYSSLNVYLVTNGLNMRQNYIDRIFNAGFDGIIYVSCHAFSKDTFERVTGARGFRNVLKNSLHLRGRHPHPERIIIQYGTDYSTNEEIQVA
jgi:hypothetical protein